MPRFRQPRREATMNDMREIRIIGARCASQETLHGYLKKKLGFPDYYGANLSALADCLSEICEPTRIVISFSDVEIEPGMQAYMLRFAQVCAREALANENLSLSIEHP